MWHGPTHRSAKGPQAYYTSPELADRVVRIARGYGGPRALYFDIGVGGGALYSFLPAPKSGIELRRLRPELPGVTYGVDVLKWTPPASWKGRDVVVVCNPPFALQVQIMNACAAFECKSLVVVWIAGLSVRQWDNEDKIDAHMHLHREWLTPNDMSAFTTTIDTRNIRTVVQVWRRRATARPLWRDLHLAPSPSVPAFTPSAKGNVIVTRVNSACQVGCAGVVGRDVRVANGVAHLTRAGQARVERATPGGCLRTSKSLGTVATGERNVSGTCLRLQTDRPEALVAAILKRRRQGAFRRLLQFRNTSSGIVTINLSTLGRILSSSWKRLARPIAMLGGRRGGEVQW